MAKYRQEISWGHTLYAAATAFLLCLAPALSNGYERSFVPTILDYDGDLEFGMSHEADENTSGGNRMKTADTASHERMRLSTTGFIYHPRFVLFSLQGAAGLREEHFDTSAQSSRTSRSADEYEFRTLVLPEHPYNLEFYTLRRKPMMRGKLLEARQTVAEQGAVFRYLNNPAFFELGTVESSLSGPSSVKSRTYHSSGSYLIGPFANSAGYMQTDSLTSLGSRQSRENAFFSSDLRSSPLFLQSRVGTDQSRLVDQRSFSLDTDAFFWTEQLSASLPGNLDAGASYGLRRDTMTTMQQDASVSGALVTKTENAGFSLNHRLYESLRTGYSLDSLSFQSGSGDSRTLTHSLFGAYMKKIPFGKLTAGVSVRESHVDRSGAQIELRELHTAPVGVGFTLNRQSVDTTSIIVQAKDPVSGNLYPLQENSNYLVLRTGMTIQITVTMLPFPLTPTTACEFTVSYTTTSESVELKTTTEGFNVRADLLDNKVSPFYSRSVLDQQVVTGSLNSGPDFVTSETVGSAFLITPYAFSAEYGTITSRFNPSRSVKTTLDYRTGLVENAGIAARMAYTRTAYGSSPAPQASAAYREETTSAEVSVQKTYPHDNIDLFLGWSAFQRRSLGKMDGYSLNGAMNWKIGKLDMNTGFSLSHSKTVVLYGKQDYNSEYYFLTVSRKLF